MLKKHLALRLNLVQGLLVLAGITTVSGLLIFTASRQLLLQTREMVLESAGIAASAIKHEMLKNQNLPIRETFAGITRDTALEELVLLNGEGKLVDSLRQGESTFMPEMMLTCGSCHTRGITEVLSSHRVTSDAWLVHKSEQISHLRAIIHIKNGPACHRCHGRKARILGVLMGDYSISRVERTQQKMLLWAVIGGFSTFVLLSLSLAALVNRWVHLPLSKLDQSMSVLASGNLTARVPALGEDEIGRIAAGFNYMASALEDKVSRLESLATTDYLTSLVNHRGFQERLASEANRSKRYGRPLSLLIVDVDHFKRINDSRGHQAGDIVLRELSKVLRSNCRELDVPTRYGGEEFAIILPETDSAGAVALAERMRRAIEEHVFPVAKTNLARVTVSIGAATFPQDSAHPDGLVMAADLAMFRAKSISRNLVCTYSKLARLGEADDPYLLHRSLKEGTVEAVVGLVESMEQRNAHSRGHSRRVANLALEVAAQLKLSEAERESLRLAALLHDLGKIGLPVELLTKPTPLTEEERLFVQSHPGVGGSLLKTIGWLAGLVPVIVHHHERFDGSGYPAGLKGEEIPLLSRILAVVNAADIVLSAQHDQGPPALEKVIAEIEQEAGRQFDPDVAEALAKVLKQQCAPVG